MKRRASLIGVGIDDPPKLVNVLCEHCVQAAWAWMFDNSTPRPADHNELCVWHFRVWIDGCNVIELHLSDRSPMMFARLYLTSQLGEIDSIINLVRGNGSFSVATPIPFDEDVAAVIRSERRFRHALSETLAFWVRLSVIAKRNDGEDFSTSMPNFQPEDKGPDGLSISISEDESKVEIYSVKSSIGDPRSLVASGSFRTGGNPKTGKLLDDFYRLEKENVGFHRLDRMLAEVYHSMNISSDGILRAAVLTRSKYNAVVVADDQHGNEEDFEGFERVRNSPKERIATYISAQCWEEIAKQTWISVVRMLQALGVM